MLAFYLHRLNCAFRSANLVYDDNRPKVVIELNLFWVRKPSKLLLLSQILCVCVCVTVFVHEQSGIFPGFEHFILFIRDTQIWHITQITHPLEGYFWRRFKLFFLHFQTVWIFVSKSRYIQFKLRSQEKFLPCNGSLSSFCSYDGPHQALLQLTRMPLCVGLTKAGPLMAARRCQFEWLSKHTWQGVPLVCLRQHLQRRPTDRLTSHPDHWEVNCSGLLCVPIMRDWNHEQDKCFPSWHLCQAFCLWWSLS